jgi:DNA replication protein DnaC
MNNQEHSTKIGSEPIGRHKYNHLKSIKKEDLTPGEIFQIEEYEQKNKTDAEIMQAKKTYSERFLIEQPTKQFIISKKWLWTNFVQNFKLLTGKEFKQTPESLLNVKVVMLYFLKDPLFFECENLNRLTIPSFDKGLLLIGGYGCGKTSTMNAIQKTLANIKGYNFRSYNANEVVKMFEGITPDNFTIDLSRKEFDFKMTNGDVYFDDLKTEREASNYGKYNLFKEILELRSSKPFKTYASCNFDQNKPNDIAGAVDEFAFKYGERVYDRIYEMFNIIEFRGTSFR